MNLILNISMIKNSYYTLLEITVNIKEIEMKYWFKLHFFFSGGMPY